MIVQVWMWRGIHLALALFIPVLLTVMMGCVKAKEFKEDLGPEVSGQAIDEALAKAVTGANFDHIDVGQFNSYSYTRRLEAEEITINLGDRRVEVTNAQENDDHTQVTFNLRITKNERLASGGFETVISEEPLVLNIGPSIGASLGVRSFAAEPRCEAISAKSVADRVVRALEDPVERVSYHHLREFSKQIDPPAAVRDRAGCGGLSNCKLSVNYIQFDMVIWRTRETYQKVSLDFAFSVDTPFLPYGESFDQFNGLMITDCRSTYVPIETRTVYVRDCLSLDDFQL